MRNAKRKSPVRSRRRAAEPRVRISRTGKGAVGGIVGTLLSEHEFIGSLLDTLQTESEKLAPGRVPDFHLLLEIVDYLVHFPDCYHHPREDLLFESLRRHDAGFAPQVERLQREHLTLHEHNAAMHELLRDIAAGKPVDRAELRQRIIRYISGYRQHMQFEAEQIFPRARGTLSAAQLHALEARTRFIDDPLFGSVVRDGYRRIARRVRAGAAELGGTLVATEVQALESMIDRLAASIERLRKLRGSERESGGMAAHQRPATLLDRLRGTAARPSWQARVLNTVTRLTVKQLMKRGSVASMRATLARLDEQRRRFMPAEVRTEAVSTPGYDGEWIRLAGQRTRRVLLYFPGGGFILSAQNQHRLMLSRICREAQARGFLVHYRLAPETPFPGGLENCIAAYHGLLQQGVRARDITLGGDSAGGGLVLSTLLALRDEGTPLPARAFVLSPLGDLTYSGESRRYNSCRDPMLPTHRASQMHELYIGDALPGDRYISPVLADFDGLPPMLGQVGSTEILLDDTVRAAEQAQRAGVPFYLEVWQDMPHVFPIMGMLPESEVAIGRIAEFIRSGRLDQLPARYGRSTPPPPPRWSLAALAG